MEIGTVKQVDIDSEMRESYLSYAMSVIVSRALPDVRDGLKPVQRRILHAMHDMSLSPDRPHRKSARVVGEVLGKYHPHGDQSVYDAMVRMAQDFSMRYPLVDGQGNFGSVDGDAAAAMRYTEARMATVGFDLLEDIERSTVDFGDNFDGSLKEPEVLPSIIPNLLVNGSSGIAVGMATSVPPHNLGEVVDALNYMLDNWEQLDEVSVKDLLEFIKGPDFPTGGLVFRYRGENDALTSSYATGRGRVTMRAKVHVEQMGRNKSRIVITELPYQTNKTRLLSKIADLHRDGKIEGLTDLRDESDRNGMRIVLETTRNVTPEDVLADLFRLTPLQSTFSIIMVALVNGQPRVLTLKQALRYYIEHRLEVIRRRSEHDLAQAKDRAHILEGLLVALQNLDDVIDTIRRSRTADTARKNLIKKLDLTETQAQAILNMPLRRLASLEQRKIRDEHKELLTLIKELEGLLSSPKLMREQVRKELARVREKYGDLRRTQILDRETSSTLESTDLLPDEQVWVLVGRNGTLARTTTPEPIRISASPKEQPLALLEANTQDLLYLFTADGQAVSLPIYQLPRSRELGEGKHWADLTVFTRRQTIVAAVACPVDLDEGYLFLTTIGGVCKRVRVSDLPGLTPDPFTVIGVADDDSLGWARLSTGDEEILLATASGQAIRFKEEDVRPMGLPAGGVRGIKMEETDGLIMMERVQPEAYLLSVTDNGLAKATAMEEYPVQGRYGQGVINVRLPKGANEVAATVLVNEGEEAIVLLSDGRTKRVTLADVSMGRRTIKPRALPKWNQRGRIVGMTVWREQLSIEEEEEEEDGEQLSLNL